LFALSFSGVTSVGIGLVYNPESQYYLLFDFNLFFINRISFTLLLRNSNALMEMPIASVNNNEKIRTALWAMVGMILGSFSSIAWSAKLDAGQHGTVGIQSGDHGNPLLAQVCDLCFFLSLASIGTEPAGGKTKGAESMSRYTLLLSGVCCYSLC
jgi:hypothetical protein